MAGRSSSPQRRLGCTHGRVIYRLRRRWRDGTEAIAFDPLTFLERLAALVPRPRAHLLTYHGVLAPAAQWLDLIVPGPGAPVEARQQGAASQAFTADTKDTTLRHRSTWAELLRHVFAIDVLTCPHCGGARRLIALITEASVVRRILEHLALPSAPPEMASARAPPEPELAW